MSKLIKKALVNGNSIKTYRADSELTQQDLADMVGCTVRAVQKLERGETATSVAAIVVDLGHRFYNQHPELMRPDFVTFHDSNAIRKYEQDLMASPIAGRKISVNA